MVQRHIPVIVMEVIEVGIRAVLLVVVVAVTEVAVGWQTYARQ